MINNWTGIGRLTKDPELTFSQSGTGICVANVAINRERNREETDFIPVKAFGKLAEIVAQHTAKGDQIGIRGRIQTGSYEKDGRRVYTWEVIAESVQFLGGKKSDSSQEPKQ